MVRSIYVKLKTGGEKWVFVSVYSPRNKKVAEVKNKFRKELTSFLKDSKPNERMGLSIGT